MAANDKATDDTLASARAAFAADRPAAAIKALQQDAAAGCSPAALILLGRCHARRGAFDAAEQAYRNALSLKPQEPGLHVHLGFFYLDWSKPEKALSAFRDAHSLDPLHPGALSGLSFYPPSVSGIDVIADVEAALAAAAPDPSVWIGLKFTRARALDRKENYDAAWRDLLAANRAYRDAKGITMQPAGGYPTQPPPGWENVFTDAREVSPAPRLIVIGGMPRAGKSTAEALLGSLAEVKTGYETNLLSEAVSDLNDAIGLDLVSGLHGLPPGYLSQFKDIVAGKLSERAEGHPVYTLTVPAPYLMRAMPVALRALPGARFVFVTRDAYDTALRIFQFVYQQDGHGYTYYLSGIMGQVGLWHDAAVHWAGVNSGGAMTIDYDAMIADPTAARAAMASLAGLTAPKTPPPMPPDDRGCAAPYRAMMEQALAQGD